MSKIIKTQDKVLLSVKKKLKLTISIDELRTIVNFPFKFAEEKIKESDKKPILINRFGRFFTTERRINYITNLKNFKDSKYGK